MVQLFCNGLDNEISVFLDETLYLGDVLVHLKKIKKVHPLISVVDIRCFLAPRSRSPYLLKR